MECPHCETATLQEKDTVYKCERCQQSFSKDYVRGYHQANKRNEIKE